MTTSCSLSIAPRRVRSSAAIGRSASQKSTQQPFSSLYAAANGRPLARVSSHGPDLNTRVTLRLDARHVARFVGATIVHHDNLVSETHRGQVPAYLL